MTSFVHLGIVSHLSPRAEILTILLLKLSKATAACGVTATALLTSVAISFDGRLK